MRYYTYHTIMENDALPPGVYGEMAPFLMAIQDGRHAAAWEATCQSAQVERSLADYYDEETGWRDLACIDEAARTRRRRWWLAVPFMAPSPAGGHAS